MEHCPCANTTWCDNIKSVYSKELFGFAGSKGANISTYNWTYLTTIAWAPFNTSELMCTAHSKGVRLIAGVSHLPFTNNATERHIWIEQTFEQIQYYHFDGVTFDYEEPMLWNSLKSQQYNALVAETTRYFHRNMAGSQISVCVAWNAYQVDGRQYDYYNLSQSVDLFYVMNYDTQSQNRQHQCLAAANAPYQGCQLGIQSYLDLGISPEKLILGVPWYGYNYSCDMQQMESMTSKYCPIPFETFRGVNCSDAAGNEKTYAILNALIDKKMNITQIRWDASMRAPFFNYIDKEHPEQVYQAWFDNVDSLQIKYRYANNMNLRGVGPFTFSQVFQTYSDTEIERAQAMWG
eukprot:549974_1